MKKTISIVFPINENVEDDAIMGVKHFLKNKFGIPNSMIGVHSKPLFQKVKEYEKK